ncbi:recombinase family protein, partial [Sphingomonas adhaesiva]|uniref:recombinase family protein n=1 Tax=Sphingomonas adhaesiva TaxID=28212 RepID=UPI00082AB313
MTDVAPRVAIYARYSSDRQSERSIEDQVRLCRERASREGWSIVDVFPDFALSGATRDRPGLNAMLARAGEFDVILAEALDRISRDQEDVAAIWKRIEFAGCRLTTVSEGAISELQIGFTGTMSAVFLKNLGDKTRRGQVGRVAAGRIPGGLCYGYEADVQVGAGGTVERGRRRIVPEQAEVIRRIFAWRAEGRSATFIVRQLNQEAVPGPTGGPWRITTLCGNRQRRNGILHNELYAGRIVFNRQRFVRDPITRKRVSRANPESEWKRQDVPDLRIVDEELWNLVAAAENAPERVAGIRRTPSKRLLSGLIRCGVCGGTFTVVGAERWGCSTARATGTCANGRTISTSQLEHRVLDALRHRLLQPDLVEAFVEEYRQASEAARISAGVDRARNERARAKVTGRIERLTTMMMDGVGAYAEMKVRLATALAERAEIDRRLEEAEVTPAVALHPGLAEAYRRNIEKLTEALNAPALQAGEARIALRNLIETITAVPRVEGRGVDLLVHGRLAQILHIANGQPDLSSDGGLRAPAEQAGEPDYATDERMIGLVAGAGYGPKQQKAPEGADCMK